jgi:hypothetical protein
MDLMSERERQRVEAPVVNIDWSIDRFGANADRAWVDVGSSSGAIILVKYPNGGKKSRKGGLL